MTPYELGGALWRRRLLAGLVLLTVLVATTVGVLVAPKTYTATGRLTVVPVGTPGDAGALADGDAVDARRATLADLASSRLVTTAVSADLAEEAGVRRSAEQLRLDVRGEWVEGTAVVEVTDADGDPQVAALVVQEVLDTLQVDVPVADGLAFTVTTAPRPPATWSSPDLLLVGGAGLVVGIVLACAAAVVRDRRRATVDDGRVAEEAAGAPLLSHVWPPDDPTTLPALDPGTVASEGFRHLRRAMAGVGAPDPDDGAPTGLVVVAGLGADDESHVWVGANLAISLATSGRRVLLVDGRLAPHGGRQLAEAPGTLGLFEVMAGAALDDAISPGPVAGLSVLPAGDAPASGARSLVDTAFAGVMDRARAAFDAVVVLPPPLQGSDEARVMASSGSMLLTVPEGGVAVTSLRRHADRTRAAGTRVSGVVLVGRRPLAGAR